MKSEISLTDLIKSDVERLEISSENYPFNLPLRISTFEGEKEYIAFVKNCEKAVRGCVEYKLWRNYIRDILQIQTCVLTHERLDQTTVDIHHHLPSLFILIKAIVAKRIEEENPFSTFDIALETIEFHFQNRVGFVPLVSSLHEKFHNGYLKIPIEMVKGDFKYFIDNYFKYLEDEDLDVMNQRIIVKMEDCGDYHWDSSHYPGLVVGAN